MQAEQINQNAAIILPAPAGNRRRDYGMRFYVNGSAVSEPTALKSGDVVTAEYLGGNVAQYPEQVAARSALRAIGNFEKVGRTFGPITIP